MHLDGSQADAEAGSELLVGIARQQAAQHVGFARGQHGDPLAGVAPPTAGGLALVEQGEGGAEAAEQGLFGKGLLDEVHGAQLHRPDRDGHLAVAGHDDDRPVDLALGQFVHDVEAVHLRHAQVEQDAAGLEVGDGFEEILAGAERMGAKVRCPQHEAQRPTNVAIVVHHIDKMRIQRQFLDRH